VTGANLLHSLDSATTRVESLIRNPAPFPIRLNHSMDRRDAVCLQEGVTGLGSTVGTCAGRQSEWRHCDRGVGRAVGRILRRLSSRVARGCGWTVRGERVCGIMSLCMCERERPQAARPRVMQREILGAVLFPAQKERLLGGRVVSLYFVIWYSHA
jgi:hypothetical protein